MIFSQSPKITRQKLTELKMKLAKKIALLFIFNDCNVLTLTNLEIWILNVRKLFFLVFMWFDVTYISRILFFMLLLYLEILSC